MKIFEKLKKMTEINTGEKQKNIIDYIKNVNSEGINQISEKTFETNHPYERSKNQSFEQCSFPGAIAISVEFDKRCQSDLNNDFLIIGYLFIKFFLLIYPLKILFI